MLISLCGRLQSQQYDSHVNIYMFIIIITYIYSYRVDSNVCLHVNHIVVTDVCLLARCMYTSFLRNLAIDCEVKS